MNVRIDPSKLSGTVRAPASKSLSQRAFAAALLHPGYTIVSGSGDSADEQAALEILNLAGAPAVYHDHALHIRSTGKIAPGHDYFPAGESGLAARLFAPIAATAAHPVRVSGQGSLLRRPMHSLIAALRAFGAEADTDGDTLPITVKGPLQGRSVTIDGSAGSQVISGLLFALGASITAPFEFGVKDLVSTPYIDLTLQVLKSFGYHIAATGYRIFRLSPRTVPADPVHFTVEGDWSNAAAWLVLAALGAAPLQITGLRQDSLQGDRAILDILSGAGAMLQWKDEGTIVCHPEESSLAPFAADLRHTPDLFPVLAVLAAAIPGESHLRGLSRLHGKESDRQQSILALLHGLGVAARVHHDTLVISGRSSFRGCEVESFNDHRIVMAAAIAAMRCDGPLLIRRAEAVNKSYPAFFSDLQSLGTSLQLTPTE